MKKIVITAGHSNTDPGATNGLVTEADIVTDFRNLVAFYLKQAGVDFVVDGEGAENKPLREAVKLVSPNRLCVEFHCNAFSDPKATGVETLSHDHLKPVGTTLCEVVSRTLGIRNRGAKGESSGQHSRLAFVQAGGLILELFFITNPDDLERYLAKKWVLARGVAGTLIELANEAVV